MRSLNLTGVETQKELPRNVSNHGYFAGRCINPLNMFHNYGNILLRGILTGVSNLLTGSLLGYVYNTHITLLRICKNAL